MLRRLAFTTLVCLGWLACVGDDPAAPTNGATGERLGPCFPDGKCKEGLECQPTEKVCVVPADASVDGGGALTEASVDAAETGPDASTLRCELAADAGVPCPTTKCAGVTSCCIDPAGGHTCQGSCPGTTKRFECDTKTSCGASTRCCANVLSETSGVACAKRASLGFSYCEAYTCPGANTRATCRTAADCATASSCNLEEVELAPGVVAVWGFCAAP